MCDFDEGLDNASAVKGARCRDGDLAKEDCPTNNVGEEWSEWASRERLCVKLLATRRGPDGAKFSKRSHKDCLANSNNEAGRGVQWGDLKNEDAKKLTFPR